MIQTFMSALGILRIGLDGHCNAGEATQLRKFVGSKSSLHSTAGGVRK
jgi:hypothetical protein